MKKAAGFLVFALILGVAGCSTSGARREPPRTTSIAGADPLLSAMVGNWAATGTIAGVKRVDDINIHWVLNGEYLSLHEVSRTQGADGKPTYEAIVLLELNSATHEYTCLWLDSTAGNGISSGVLGRGKAEVDSIPFLFKIGNGEIFHTTFHYNRAEKSWNWVLDNESGGKLEPFARLTLRPGN
jgi:hypothetical protein